MYWSGYDTLVLVSGIGFVIAAILPISGVEPRYRVGFAIFGVVMVIGSFITGSMQSFTYPSGIQILPAFPILLVIVWAVQSARKKNATADPAVQAQHLVAQVMTRPAEQAAPPIPAPPTTVSPLAAKAADPATDQAELASLAHEHAELRPLIAANPSAYPGLLEWLAQFDDPVVQAALQSRQG